MSKATTPMMRQYRRIKGELPPDVLLLFRLGDFYEMFFEDAREAAPILDIALTRRNDTPMCGVPYHAAEGYIAKLVKAGRKVAVCDQVEDASASKGIVRREVTRIITAGTVTEESVLESDRHNFLAGVSRDGDAYGLALLDLSTGSFFAEEAAGQDALRQGLQRLAPTECLVPSAQAEDEGLRAALSGSPGIQRTSCEDWSFGYDAAREELTRHFGVHSLEGFGCEGNMAVVGAAGGVLCYVKGDLRRNVDHVRTFHVRHRGEHMLLDDATCANLDVAAPRGVTGRTTLLSVLDATRTAMGARTLRDWILRPLVDAGAIRARHDAVEALQRDRALMRDMTESFAEVRDMERLAARVSTGSGNGRDLVALGHSLSCLPDVKRRVEGHACATLAGLGASIVPLPDLVALVERAIADEPPITVREGGVIRDGYNADLDELRKLASEGRQWLAEYQVREQERTGIKTLKVRHNKVFGYYLEVSKGQLDNVPDDYVRKQTLVNAERFFTPELKEYESKVLGAQDRAMALEYDLFLDVRKAAADEIDRIQSSARAVGCLDVLVSFADRSLALGYTRPEITEDRELVIRGGRHPVVEQMPDAERFVPNDAVLDGDGNQVLIITGPNMAGKSTYIRQVALIVIMAQVGSFVPADKARIGVVDRVFSRVGASDDLARGRSTFMVEMQETANILNSATERSLIVLDEIGRGTSTFDGISIAWAVAEHLHNNAAVKAKTLFATHYHELADLAHTLPGVKNYTVLVRERGGRVAFLRKIVEGSSDKSYGIHVARLAGLPPEVIDRAQEILTNLEEGEFGDSGQPRIARHRPRKGRYDPAQLGLFGDDP